MKLLSTLLKGLVVMDNALFALMKDLMGPDLEPHRLLKLDQNQKNIVASREVHRQEVLKLIDDLKNASNAHESREILDSINRSAPLRCEHDRSNYSTCMACMDIEQLMYPEYYCSECSNTRQGVPGDSGLCLDCDYT